MLILKKVISAVLLPPGCFIVVLIAAGSWSFRRQRRAWGGLAVTLGLILWGMSLWPVANYLMKGLESGLTIPARLNGDAIILLGGGVKDGVRDLTGMGAPSDDAMSRLVTAVRAQKRSGVPVIVSGGAFRETDTPEAWILSRFLQDLGVPRSKIVIEDRSRDTEENARYVAALCARNGFRHPLLVTSAYHMKRSALSFQRHGLAVTPLPASFCYDGRDTVTLSSFLPRVTSLAGTVTALHEHLGLLYYRLTLPDSD